MNKFLCFLYLCLLYSNSIAGDLPINDDDDIDSSIIHIDLYETYNDCIDNNNVLYNYKNNFNFRCNCTTRNKCFNSFMNSSIFNTLFIEYNNSKIYLNKLNYTGQCQKYKNYYIYYVIDIYTFCSTYLILFVFLILLLIVGILSFSNYKCRKKRYTKINGDNGYNEVPPNYDAIN
jgi:hypothetical protein